MGFTDKIGIVFAAGLRIGILAVLIMALLTACQVKDEKAGRVNKIQVVTALFPLYDFARNIGQDRADVFLLMPPGLEPHSFEPKPADVIRLNRADLFIYTNPEMEPWAENVLKGLQNRTLKVIEAGRGIEMMAGGGEERGHSQKHRHHAEGKHGHNDGHGGGDPHIWLNFANAAKMVDHILAGFMEKDPQNGDFYRKNADAFKAKLNDLDRQFRDGLSACRKKVIVHGGHAAFSYLAERYDLKYVAVSGFSPDAEPTPANLVRISKTLKANGLNHLFYEELLSPRVAESIARETGASLLMLHGAHNVGKEDFERGVGFVDLMQMNLQNLKRGLQCPQP